MEKLIVLDRDGVINEDSDAYIKSPDEFIPIPGSLDAISKLNHAGYKVVVATNQSGLARGYFDQHTLELMHQKLDTLLKEAGGRIDKIYVCPHGPRDNCSCRKPEPGLLTQILADYGVKAEEVIAIGDSLRDLQAAEMVNMVPVLVRTGKGLSTESDIANDELFAHVKVFDDLKDAVDQLLNISFQH